MWPLEEMVVFMKVRYRLTYAGQARFLLTVVRRNLIDYASARDRLAGFLRAIY